MVLLYLVVCGLVSMKIVCVDEGIVWNVMDR